MYTFVYEYGMMLNILTTKVMKMGFLEERIPHSTDKKKVVSARVSENVLAALNSAEEDIGERYKFSIANIIDKALNDTLDEIKDKTGIDYYKLIIWGDKILSAEKNLPPSQAHQLIDMHEEIQNFKDYFVVTRGLDGQLDFYEQLQKYEDSIVDGWNDWVKDHDAVVEKNTLNIFWSEPIVGAFADPPVKNALGHTVQTISKLLKKSTDEVIEILNNAGVTGKNSDSRISTDDRQKLMNSLSRSSSNDINIKFK